MGKQKKIVFVNSFKGGTGKTTFSFSNCIDALFNTKEYENVIYLDLDILGTATSYLFERDKLPGKDSFDKTGKLADIVLNLGGCRRTLHVGYLSPELKNNSMYGEAPFVHHQKLAEELLFKRVEDFIEKRINQDIDSLIVIDCAPGFGEMEQRVLDSCYHMAPKAGVVLEEKYLVTLDSAHVEKCIQCLKDNRKMVSTTKRSACIVVNDVQNYCDYLIATEGDYEPTLGSVMEEIHEKISGLNMTFRLWKYSENIARNAIYTRKKGLENNVSDYLFTGDNYVEWKEGEWVHH